MSFNERQYSLFSRAIQTEKCFELVEANSTTLHRRGYNLTNTIPYQRVWTSCTFLLNFDIRHRPRPNYRMQTCATCGITLYNVDYAELSNANVMIFVVVLQTCIAKLFLTTTSWFTNDQFLLSCSFFPAKTRQVCRVFLYIATLRMSRHY